MSFGHSEAALALDQLHFMDIKGPEFESLLCWCFLNLVLKTFCLLCVYVCDVFLKISKNYFINKIGTWSSG